MWEWSRWSPNGFISLQELALLLGIASPKTEVDGSKVFDLFRNGRMADIADYCKKDVDTVRRVYRRMTFS